jgi:actin-like ATPase involved in cell morphogenesis
VSYQVGIDLGTTYTAAAVHRNGTTTVCALGDRGATIPSVVLLRSDGTFLTGQAAERRAATEPERVVREFKRRFGDSTPIIVAGSPYSAEALSARLLQAVVAQVSEREGGDPERIVVTYPANWGDYKKELLDQMIRLAGLDGGRVGYVTEPEAAALAYAAQERVEAGEVVAVYDLGGGTFDAAVLRRTATGFAIVGRPEGIERLGGIDFDAAVFAHVAGLLGDAITDLDPDDPAALAAVTRLRRDCVDAKEALSSDVDASIPVLLPTKQTEVRITRHELEALIRPSLLDSVEAMKRAVRSADLELDQISRVLLVGGSSRIPVVSQLVASELGRPLAVDAHPKHAVALGAAWAASGLLDQPAEVGQPDVAGPPSAPPPSVPTPAPSTPAPSVPTPAPSTPAPSVPTPAPSTPAGRPGIGAVPSLASPAAAPGAVPVVQHGREGSPAAARADAFDDNRTVVAPSELPDPEPAPAEGRPGKAKPVSQADLARPGLVAPSATPPTGSPRSRESAERVDTPGGSAPAAPPRSPPSASPASSGASPAPSTPPDPPPGRSSPSWSPVSPGSPAAPAAGGASSSVPKARSEPSRARPVSNPGLPGGPRPPSGARPPQGGRPPSDAGPTAIYRPGNEGGATAVYRPGGDQGRTSVYPGSYEAHGVRGGAGGPGGGYPPGSSGAGAGQSARSSAVSWILAIVILAVMVGAAVYLLAS